MTLLSRDGPWWLLSLLLVATTPVAGLAEAGDDAFATTLRQLPEASFADKETLAGELLASGHPSASAVLTAMLEDRLFVTADRRVVIAASGGEDAPERDIVDPVTLKRAGSAAAAELTKVGTNNRLRRFLRTSVARFALASPDASVRLAAVENMARSLDDSTIEQLRPLATTEPDPGVRRAVDTALAMAALDGTDAQARLAAVATLSDRLGADVRNRLAALVEVAPDGTPAESDAQVRAAATKALQSIDATRSLYSGVETLFFGLSLGSVLVLAAIGLAITFGVMGVINMAHGELMMLGAYTVYVVQQLLPDAIGASVLIAIPLAFLVSGLVGVAIERGVVRFLYGRPLETLLATFGVSLLLQQLVRDIFSPNNRPVQTPEWMAGSWQVNEVMAITWTRIYIVVFAALVFIALLLVLKRTSLGLHVRAVAQNRAMARAMGIRTDWVDALTFGLGAGIAGVAGVALSQLTNVGPNLGQSYIVDSFMVVVFGGVGNLWGTLISGLSLGVANKLFEPLAGAVLAKILILVALILFIQRRPRGLFPQKGRSAES